MARDKFFCKFRDFSGSLDFSISLNANAIRAAILALFFINATSEKFMELILHFFDRSECLLSFRDKPPLNSFNLFKTNGVTSRPLITEFLQKFSILARHWIHSESDLL